jgi:DNA helicase II / ATP-dependent DNA helicase PcrA
MFKPRPMQAEVLRYRGGKMGVSAVPGSGKTQTLSYLASLLIAEDYIDDDQEVLIVTLVNSAVDNFAARVEGFIKQSGLLPGMGYRVRTLHGLANDIVRERPDLAGLGNHFQIIDEPEAREILENAAIAWIRSHPDFMLDYTAPDYDPFKDFRIQRDWQNLIVDIAGAFIRQAKDLQITPADIQQQLETLKTPQPLLEMGCDIYTDYQRGLNYRGAADFDDLIRLALQAIKSDPDFLERLRRRWPFILEDEAQDSSRLQEEILRLLTGPDGNWVRVGDPNQAIYETFTTASPQFLLDFMNEPDVIKQKLPNSGRSTHSIITLANYLIDWTRIQHPNQDLRSALTTPKIEATPARDPQPNPQDQPEGIKLIKTRYEPDQELNAVVRSLQSWMPENQDKTAAVLVPRNERGSKLVAELKKAGLEYVELLRSSLSTRETAALLATILRALADPSSTPKLAKFYKELRQRSENNAETRALYTVVEELLRKCTRLEDYLWPLPDSDWMEDLHQRGVQDAALDELDRLRFWVGRWQQATLLPVDQLLLTISQDLFTNPAELALTHKLALAMEHTANVHPDWHLEEFTLEMENIAQNRRKFVGFSEEDTGFDPDKHKGKVVVATIHKAKGLEWDRVYLMSASNYDFPSGESYDYFMGEKWYVRNRLNLPAEALSKLKALVNKDLPGIYTEEGVATYLARTEYAAERLRLLYVGITRARKELVITWNTGKRNDNVECLPLTALREYWEGNYNAP